MLKRAAGVRSGPPCRTAAPRCAARADALRVGGFVPFTSTDYPGALAAVVFCQGCPWRCGYCHNPHLIPARGDDERDFARIVEWLGTRRGLLDAVVFSGGEPTAQAELAGRDRGGARARLQDRIAHRRRVSAAAREGAAASSTGSASTSRRRVAEYASVTGVAGSGGSAFASLDLVRVAASLRSAHDGAPGADAASCPRAACAGARRSGRRALDAAAVSRDGLRERSRRRLRAGRRVADRALLARLSKHVPVIEVRDSDEPAAGIESYAAQG